MAALGNIVGFVAGRGVRRRERRLQRHVAEERRRAAQRELEKFEQFLPLEQRGLEASLARRGMSQSSIGSEKEMLFRSEAARSRERLTAGVQLADEARRVLRAQHRYARIMEPIAFLDGMIETAAMGATLGAFGGGTTLGAQEFELSRLSRRAIGG